MTIVIFAAGTASRMGGRQKLLLHIEGQPIIERIIAAAAEWPIVVVAGDEVAVALGATPLRVVRNAAPERGMAHSLRLADAAITTGEPIAVLLGDLADITADAIRTVLDAYDDTVDIVAARCGGVFAHPVVFGPRARAKIAALPDGDTIKHLRDDADLRRRFVEIDASALADIDTPDDYALRTGRGASDAGATP